MTDVDQGSPPPAWYSDPDDISRLRFWDGSRWTEHRAAATRTTPAGTNWPVWVGLGAVALALVVLAGLGVLVAIGFWASQSAIEDSAELQVGDCLTDLDGDIVNNPPLIDCALPHRAEVIAKVALPAGPYPGRDEVPALASAACRTQFKLFVGRKLESSELNQFILWPIEATWRTNRETVCLVFDYADVTGSFKGANR